MNEKVTTSDSIDVIEEQKKYAELKRHVISFALTAVSGFAVFFAAFIAIVGEYLQGINSISDISGGAIVAVISAGALAGVRSFSKFLLEKYVVSKI